MIAVYFRVMAPHFMLQRGIWVSSPNKEINPISFRWRAELPGPGNMAQTNTCVSRITGVMGETGSIWWNTALLLPLAFTNCHEAQGRGGKKKGGGGLKRGWERGASRREGERDSTRWIMQSCQRQLLLEVLAVLKGSSADLQQLPSHCSPRLRATWSVLRQMVNKMRRRREGVSRWQVNCLRGTYRQRQPRSLLQLFTEVTDREIWADLHGNPGGNIITKQRNSEELPFQHSTPWWLLHLHKMLRVLKSGVCVPARF